METMMKKTRSLEGAGARGESYSSLDADKRRKNWIKEKIKEQIAEFLRIALPAFISENQRPWLSSFHRIPSRSSRLRGEFAFGND
jgi:hypothetical protein